MRYGLSLGWSVVLVGVLMLPAHSLTAQQRTAAAPPGGGQGSVPDQLRTAANSSSYMRKLSPSETLVRNDVTMLRDSIDVVAGFAERLSRAAANNTQSVMLSAATFLRPACAAAARSMAPVKARFAGITLSVEDKDQRFQSVKYLAEYRTSLASLAVLMSNCEKDIGTMMARPKPDPVQLGRLATNLNNGILTYEAHLRVMLNHFDLPMLPKVSK